MFFFFFFFRTPHYQRRGGNERDKKRRGNIARKEVGAYRYQANQKQSLRFPLKVIYFIFDIILGERTSKQKK